ncbi:TIGR03943 family putative permease subunit [Streptomyces mangrovisoli]|uniref:TIGR03943 family protein n=1 Tax=Streptomyces mangrovisoli TaxID=1428628 RepID=A0A1J4P809_9ACTN|nr:TIGR03943 family protein [Streptomyces mangrovisoli]OIJ69662.1 TIGR03943 family protein [Streptomyces mangrovisoli]
MNRQAQTAVLFLIGAALLHAGMTDLYLRYVKAGLRPLLLLAGVVLIVTALATAWYEWRRGRRTKAAQAQANAREGEAHEQEGESHAHETEPHETEPHETEPHETEPHSTAPHVHPEPRVSWFLLVPLFALILVAPPALGSYSAVRTGTALQKPYGYTALPATDPLPMSLVDYAGRAAYDHGRHLTNRRVQVTGFVALDGKGAPYLVRMALNCCAADAQPVKIALTGKIPPVLQPDSWLQVTGTYTPKTTRDPVNNGLIPYIEVTQAKPVPTPKDPYDESWNQ